MLQKQKLEGSGKIDLQLRNYGYLFIFLKRKITEFFVKNLT